MGLLMRNGIEYSGGGGSESGDVNVYGAFIDPSRIIVSSSYTSNLSYTATEDCFIYTAVALNSNTGGSCAIDGQNIAEVTQESLRGQISMVPQDALLFHRTIKENIAY